MLIAVVGVAILLAVAAGSPKSGVASKSGSAKKPATAQPASKWTTHKDPAGFSVELPPGWKVKVQPKSGRIDITGASSEKVVILPFFIPDNPDDKAFPSILKALAKQEVAGAKWDVPLKRKARVLCLPRDFGGSGVLSSD